MAEAEQRQVAEGLIGRLRARDPERAQFSEEVRPAPVPGQQRPAHLSEAGQGKRVLSWPQRPGPEALLVELDHLLVHPSVHHGAEAAIAHGQRFQPASGGLGVPKGLRFIH